MATSRWPERGRHSGPWVSRRVSLWPEPSPPAPLVAVSVAVGHLPCPLSPGPAGFRSRFPHFLSGQHFRKQGAGSWGPGRGRPVWCPGVAAGAPAGSSAAVKVLEVTPDPGETQSRAAAGAGKPLLSLGWGSPVCGSQGPELGGVAFSPPQARCPLRSPRSAGPTGSPQAPPSQPWAPPGGHSAVGEGSSGSRLSRAVQCPWGQGCWEGLR